MASNLDIGFDLDRQWHRLRGHRGETDVDPSKRPALIAIARLLDEHACPYALIGGLAVQVHRAEPRTTIDVDVAVESLTTLPRAALVGLGFRETGRFAHSENWIAPNGTPVQFTDDAPLRPAIERAVVVELDGLQVRVLAKGDLVREKLRACRDPARRRSKRFLDYSDAIGLVEENPELADGLSEEERALLRTPPA